MIDKKQKMEKYKVIMLGWLPFMTSMSVAQQNRQPNIVLINIDDLGWTDLSCNGSCYYETPNIDRLRTQGIWFNDAYAGASNSAPSRACMLTGMNTPRHGMFTVDRADRGKSEDRKLIPVTNKEILDDGIQMLPQVLKDAGYQTCHIGKWHVTEDPTRNGIEVNVAGNHAGHPASYFSPYKNKNLKDGPKGESLQNRLADEAVNYLKNVNKEKPFFLYYATYAVHTPLQAEKFLIEKYKNKKGTEAHYNPVYAAMIEAMDRNVGRILNQIKLSGIEKNTLIVFTTDNGGVYDISKQWPLRAGKGSFYEGGIRVPLIVYQEGKYEKCEVKGIPVMQMDLFPTFLDLANISDKNLLLDGKSLVPLLVGKAKKLKERALFWNFPGYLEGGNAESHDKIFRTTPVSVVRKGDWKLIQYYETDEIELFNVSEDISERKDLSKEYPAKTKQLLKLLTKWKKRTKAPVPTKLNPYYKTELK